MKIRIGKFSFGLFDVLFDVAMLCAVVTKIGNGSDSITKAFLILGCLAMSPPILFYLASYLSENAYTYIMNSEINRINKESCYYNAIVTVALALLAFVGHLYYFCIFFSVVAVCTISLNHEAYRLRLLALEALRKKQDS